MTSWVTQYNDRERRLIEFCRNYKADFADVGATSHFSYLLIAMLAEQLDHMAAALAEDGAGDYTPPAPARPHIGATVKQLDLIARMAQSKGIDDARLAAMCAARYAVQQPQDLSKEQASALIDDLKKDVEF